MMHLILSYGTGALLGAIRGADLGAVALVLALVAFGCAIWAFVRGLIPAGVALVVLGVLILLLL